MSALTRSAPVPAPKTNDDRWSIETYATDDLSTDNPSLTLAPAGEDRSTISRHFPGLCFLGIAPRGLKWIFGDLTSCLHILPSCTSHSRYCDITTGFLVGMLAVHH